MGNPTMLFSQFKGRAIRNTVKLTHTYTVYPENGFQDMGYYMAQEIERARINKDEHYWSFARYKRNHQKADILELTAIPLEFPYSSRAELADALLDFPYVHYIIHAQDEINTARPEERLLVAVPLVTPISDKAAYTRCASLISGVIGLGEHSKGDFSCTFLFAPFTGVCSTPTVTLFDVEREFLDADAFYEENRGIWTNASAYQEGAAPLSIKPVVIDDTGLFAFPA